MKDVTVSELNRWLEQRGGLFDRILSEEVRPAIFSHLKSHYSRHAIQEASWRMEIHVNGPNKKRG